MLIDTHCHLSFGAFDDSWREAVRQAREKDIKIIVPGAARATSEKAITIAQEDGVFASIGLHPAHVADEEFDASWFREQAKNPNVVAIGECGVDHYHIGEERKEEALEKQELLLREHLEIARENNLPVILHSRDGKVESSGAAYERLIRVVREFGYFRCVKHCFSSNWEMAKQLLDLGLMLSFTGMITFKNASNDLLEVVQKAPLDRFMVETDSPYLSPEPMRGKQNEPAYVEYVARGIARLRGEPYSDIVDHTTQNAIRFFGLDSEERQEPNRGQKG